jgi:hypothetical protein
MHRFSAAELPRWPSARRTIRGDWPCRRLVNLQVSGLPDTAYVRICAWEQTVPLQLHRFVIIQQIPVVIDATRGTVDARFRLDASRAPRARWCSFHRRINARIHRVISRNHGHRRTPDHSRCCAGFIRRMPGKRSDSALRIRIPFKPGSGSTGDASSGANETSIEVDSVQYRSTLIMVEARKRQWQ